MGFSGRCWFSSVRVCCKTGPVSLQKELEGFMQRVADKLVVQGTSTVQGTGRV